MATTTTKVTRVKLTLNNTKTATLNLPEPINMTLTDPDTGQSLLPSAYTGIAAAYASDDGATVVSADFSIVSTTTTDIAENYTGGDV